MAITRRNTLILLLTVVAAAGVIGGTGAFSTVDADRSVSVNTATDTNANVQFSLDTTDHPSVSNDGDDTLGMNFNDVNLNANTTYNDVVNITVNSAQSGSYNVAVTNEPSDIDVNFDGSDSTSVSAGNTVQADVTVTTYDDVNTSDVDIDEDTVTFTVTAQ
jgi:hypothetical protein